MSGRKLTVAVIMVLVMIVIMGGVALVELQPFMPGSAGYIPQRFLTNLSVSLIINPEHRTDRLLDLAGYRLEDYLALDGDNREFDALLELDSALRRAAIAVSELDGTRQPVFLDGLHIVARQVVTFLGDHTNQDPQVIALEDAVRQRAQAILDGELVVASAVSKNPAGRMLHLAEEVPFQQSALQGHPFTLDGAHTSISCEACHTTGAFEDLTASGCIDCHDDPHDDGRSTTCENCHSTSAWKPALMDHTGLTDCLTCHEPEVPAGHYTQPCLTCHNTTDWKVITVDHTTLTDCASCHLVNAPPLHYAGQCSKCHITANWTQVTMDHSGLTDCASCHAPDAPPNHWAGQCSTCHNTFRWSEVAVNHTGLTDCAACHASRAPANHYPGQCSTCHNTSIWSQVTMNHAGLTDCASCHASRAPANHYPGQCSACHNTSRWSQVSFNHSGLTDCRSCHASRAPANHFPGQCSDCHSTSSWSGATFNHTFPRTHGDASQCSDCHTAASSGDYSSWTCYAGCHKHDQAENEKHHAEEGLTSISNCISCHPTGKKD